MSILEQIDSGRKDFLAEIESFPEDSEGIDVIRSKYLGRKGQVAQLFTLLGNSSPEERPVLGQKLNDLKNELTQLFEDKISPERSVLKSNTFLRLMQFINLRYHKLFFTFVNSSTKQGLKYLLDKDIPRLFLGYRCKSDRSK